LVGSRKHLVLDDDVHAHLTLQKRTTGLSLQEIGNSQLRAGLRPSQLCHLLRTILTEAGQVTPSGYDAALREAASQLQEATTTGKLPIQRTEDGTFVSGSWELREAFRSVGNAFQIMECWARDANRLPMELHAHTADEYIIVLAGTLLLELDRSPVVLEASDHVRIPGQIAHAITPLDRDCHAMKVMIPAEPEYSLKE